MGLNVYHPQWTASGLEIDKVMYSPASATDTYSGSVAAVFYYLMAHETPLDKLQACLQGTRPQALTSECRHQALNGLGSEGAAERSDGQQGCFSTRHRAAPESMKHWGSEHVVNTKIRRNEHIHL